MVDSLYTPLCGMALSTIGVQGAAVNDFADFANFRAIELAPDFFFDDAESSPLKKKIFSGGFSSVVSGGLVESSLTRSIAFDSTEKMRRAYALECSFQARRLAERGVRHIALEFPMNEILVDVSAYRAALEIVRGLSGVLAGESMKLHLPFSIPFGESDTPSLMMKFLRETLVPSVGIRLEVHPVRLEKSFTVETVCPLVHFEALSAVFIYDADCGTHITKEYVLPWLDYFRVHRRNIPLFAAPFSQRQRSAFPEAEIFSRLIPEL